MEPLDGRSEEPLPEAEVEHTRPGAKQLVERETSASYTYIIILCFDLSNPKQAATDLSN
jgi:hypothetical protein